MTGIFARNNPKAQLTAIHQAIKAIENRRDMDSKAKARGVASLRQAYQRLQNELQRAR